ncbi:MAG: cellulase family glycosylhydrolase [Kofleriaceae bacterium]|nr:cellulase family glycosylhydrolase [Myxococcales bacterium]MCB9562390.1 cellulase family glycosylhydrolase [Kofleriaceae bacterium]
MRRSACLIPLAVAAAACGGDDPPPAPTTAPLYADGAHLRDAQGRIALLRGVNARVEGVFDVTFDDGRTALEPIPALDAADCRRMRELGLDLLRLPINWSGIEPERDVYDEAYLARVDAAIDCAGDAGVLVLVDLHQDAYSKEIGEDGAPLWAIVPAPEMLLEGPLEDLGARRTSMQVTQAFNTFFDVDDAAGLQAEFRDMLAMVAARWADHPAVIGFELFNEPSIGQDEVDVFTAAAAETVRAAAPGKLVFFEPTALRNLFDFVPLAEAPFATDGAVYAPHVYTFVFGADPTPLEQLEPADLEPSVVNARDEAAAWGTPLLFGEYGVGPDTPNADLWMGVEAELHDRYLASDAFWVWKERSQASWGLYDYDDATGAWTERPRVVGWLSRVHAARIAGEPVANLWDRTTGALRLEVTPGSTHGVPHEVYVPEAAAATYTVRCDGAAVTPARDAATGLISLPCDGVLEVTP